MRERHRVAGLAVIIAAVAGAGCTAFYWSKPGATPAQFATDSEECAREAAPSPATVGYGVVVQDAYQACLTKRGYARTKQYAPVPGGYYRGLE